LPGAPFEGWPEAGERVGHQHPVVEEETLMGFIVCQNFMKFSKIRLFLEYPVTVVTAVYDMLDLI
jgi:hypothetical protein